MSRTLGQLLRKLDGTMFELNPQEIDRASHFDGYIVPTVWLMRVLEALDAYVNSDEWLK